MKLWPWSRLARLSVDLRAARLSCSAEAKRANRLAARIAKLDAAIVRLRAQCRRDQAYIDALERHLHADVIDAARAAVREGQQRNVGDP